MIKYFKELENRDNQSLQLIEERFKNNNIRVNFLPLEFYQKYGKLFSILSDLDVLFIKTLDNNQPQSFLNDELSDGYDFARLFASYVNKDEDIDMYLTLKGKNRIDFLMNLLNANNNNLEDLSLYLLAILDLMFIHRNGNIYENREQVRKYLSSTLTIAKYQNRLPKQVEKSIQEALSEIDKFEFEIPKTTEMVNLKLPNTWYITPNKHLYNEMGSDSHQGTKLIPLFRKILKKNDIQSPQSYLKETIKSEQNGFIIQQEYEEYLNFKYDFACFHYDYNCFNKRSYNPKLVTLVNGVKSAYAGFYDFFYRLRQYSNNFEEDLKFLQSLDFDYMLIRCCGFHKVTSFPVKIITTSLINYKEEFKEYIEKGWKIDFLPPIIINERKGKLEEYPEEFLKIRKILKDEMK